MPIDVVGQLNSSGKIRVFSKNSKRNNKGEVVLDFNLRDIEELPKQKIVVPVEEIKLEILPLTSDVFDFVPVEPEDLGLYKVFSDISVGSKRYLVHKVDRSVGGLVLHNNV